MSQQTNRGGNPPDDPGNPGNPGVPPPDDKGKPNPNPNPIIKRRPYAGAARISHTGNEFIIDFGDTDPDNPQAVVMHTGVKLSPQTAKCLLIALRENIQKYEAKFGKMGWPPDDADTMPDWSKLWN